jgi:hypothetical protein
VLIVAGDPVEGTAAGAPRLRRMVAVPAADIAARDDDGDFAADRQVPAN